jgi:acyl-CoA thioester hydrolase
MITLDQLNSLPVYHRETIPENYRDVMGHMNIRWYMALFDEAAWGFFAEFGIDVAYCQATDSGAFALKHFISYLAEVHVGETVAIRTRLLGYSPKRVHFMHFMVNESTNTLAATMEVLGAHADLIARRTSPFPPFIAAQLEAMLQRDATLAWDVPLCGVITA